MPSVRAPQPALAPPDPAKFIVFPKEFQEAVEKAQNDEANGLGERIPNHRSQLETAAIQRRRPC